jgi:eukaryotic-like serine/threonine-protein kinase
VISFQETDRFIHRQHLGSGSFGSVHEVFDQERQSCVAIKVPHEATARSLFLFKKEFRALADISHPNLVTLHELISDGNRWFFTMELIEGIDILRFLRFHRNPEDSIEVGIDRDSVKPMPVPLNPLLAMALPDDLPTSPEIQDADEDELPPVSAPPDFQLVTRTFKQLGQGLIALHRAGWLHQDIKPSNVLVTAKGRVVLLDFGLSSEIDSTDEDPAEASEITGTPAYMAPEQLFDHKCTEASDWYSVGVLLYHVLTGRLPFQGNGLRALVNKVSQTPAAPVQLVSGIPAEINDLCMELLRPRPEERPTGTECLQRLTHSEGVPFLARPAAPGIGFVGRSLELNRLSQAFQALQDGEPAWINLHGSSGMGKTFLIRKFRREVKRIAPDALILSGRCYEQEDVPYKALDGLVDALSQHLKHLPAARIEAIMPRHISALAQVFPVLRQVVRVSESLKRHTDIADPQTLRHRAFGALRELLHRIGDHQPLVLIIDDLHWGDADSVTLLADILSPPDPPLMLLVACFRTEESSTSPTLREFLALGRANYGHCLDIPLREFPPGEARQLAQDLLNREDSDAEDLAKWIAMESGGNPFFIHELARHAYGQALSAQTKDPLGARIHSRVEMLPNEAQQILRLISLAGYPLDWQVIKEAARIETSGIDSLDTLRHVHLIRIRTAGQRRMVEPYHDFIRKAVAASLPLEQARQGHLQLAQAIEASPEPDVQALAMHYQAAGETEKAIVYLTTAGFRAFAALAFGRAASLLRMSLNLRSADDQTTAVIRRHLGEALANTGRGREAAEAYLSAVPYVAAHEANELQRLAAQEYLRNGHFEDGITVLRAVLRTFGTRLSASRTHAFLSTLFHKTLLHLRGLHCTERNIEEIPQGALDRLDAYWVTTVGLAAGDLMQAADFQARQLFLSLQTGEPVRLVRALAYEAIFSSSRGIRNAETTQRYLRLALMQAERLGDPNPLSQALIASGLAHMAIGQWRKGAETLDRVEAMLRDNSVGLAYELRNAQSYALINHYALGNLKVLSERLPALFRDAEETGDLLFLANLVTGSAFIHHLARNEPDFARQNIRQTMERLPVEGFFQQRYLELAALGNIELYSGHCEKGWAQFTLRWNSLRHSQLMHVQMIRITSLELRARLALAVSFGTPDPAERARLRSRAARDARTLRREGVDYGRALALRLEAIEAWLAGQRDEAHGKTFLAEMAFDSCDMALHGNVMKRCRGLLKGPSGKDLVQEAEAWMHGQGIVSPSRMMAMHLPGMDLEEKWSNSI